jgi:tetratricopeptide (TPR) repeat protein
MTFCQASAAAFVAALYLAGSPAPAGLGTIRTEPSAELSACLASPQRPDPMSTIAYCSSYLEGADKEPATSRSQAFGQRGYLHRLQGNAKAAMADFTSALAIDPSNTLARADGGSLRLAASDLDATEDDFRRVVALKPNFLDTLVGICLVLEQCVDASQALSVLRAALELGNATPLAAESTEATVQQAREALARLAVFGR